ncbi:MAG: YjbF family lipoprotein [Paracoccaceae bacterium]
MLLIAGLVAACAPPGPADMPDLRGSITADQLAQVKAPLLLAELPSIGVAATLVARGRNGDVQTWETGDRVSIAFRRGVLTGTRGLGDDLMQADLNGSLRMLQSGEIGTYYPRIHSYLDGEYQTVFRSFQCTKLSERAETIETGSKPRSVKRIEEACYSPGLEITNVYWRGTDGIMWKSRQWVSARVGYLTAERLVK